MQTHGQNPGQPQVKHHHHHILSTRLIMIVGAALLFLTIVTVWIAGVDLGRLNFPVAMLVASIKATLVAAIFMNLKYDRRENAVIFLTSFLFLAIFIAFSFTDLFFRGDVYVKGPIFKPVQAKSQFKKAWVSTPELVAHGKQLFDNQCASCHGAEGQGNGVAAAALNPPPRNFTTEGGWKNGRTLSGIFKTLKEGIPGTGMASYETLPAADRWALAHYVGTFAKPLAPVSNTELAAVGVDPSQENGGAAEEKPTIPVNVAMKQLIKEQEQDGTKGNVVPGNPEYQDYSNRLDTRLQAPKPLYTR